MLNGKIHSEMVLQQKKRELPLKKADPSIENIVKDVGESYRQKALEDLRKAIVDFQEGNISSKELISFLNKANVAYSFVNPPSEGGISRNCEKITFDFEGKNYTFNLKWHDDVYGYNDKNLKNNYNQEKNINDRL